VLALVWRSNADSVLFRGQSIKKQSESVIDNIAFAALIEKILASLPLPPQITLEGIYLVGSYTKLLATERSDIDLYGISKERNLWRKFYRAFEVDIDFFALPEVVVRQAIAARKPVLLTSIAEGKILRDTNDTLKNLQDAVKARVIEGPSPLTLLDRQSVCHRFTTIVDDCEDCADDDPNAAILMMVSSLKLLSEIYLASIGEWDASQRQTFRAIGRINAVHGQLFERVSCESASARERLDAFRIIADHALKPYGGMLRYFESPILPTQ
jgi:hypothetical protein